MLFLVLGLWVRLWAAEPDVSSITVPKGIDLPLVRLMADSGGLYSFQLVTSVRQDAIVSLATTKKFAPPAFVRSAFRGEGSQPLEVARIPEIENRLGLLAGQVMVFDWSQRWLHVRAESFRADPAVPAFDGPRKLSWFGLKVGRGPVPAPIDWSAIGLDPPGRPAYRRIIIAPRIEVGVRPRIQLSSFYFRGGLMQGLAGLGRYVFDNPFVALGAVIPGGDLGCVSLHDVVTGLNQTHRILRVQSHWITQNFSRGELPVAAAAPMASR
jgi:hypothetical protein